MTLLQTRRSAILAAIDAMPAKLNPYRARLDFVTRDFLQAPLFSDAVMYGYSDAELFAVDPARCAARPDRAGIVSGIALSALAVPKLIRIEARKAVVECGNGNRSLLTHRRTGRTDQLGVVWWHSPELGGRLPETQIKRIAAAAATYRVAAERGSGEFARMGD